MSGRKRVLLGHITGAHGIRGEVQIKAYTARPEDIGGYGPLEDEEGTRHFDINSVRVGPKGVGARLKGVADRTAAEGLRGTALYVERRKLPAPTSDEFYHSDLIGLAVHHPDGAHAGKVVAVLNYGAGDILEIETTAGGPTELVPFTASVVPEIDIAAGRLVVVRPAETTATPEADDDAG